MTLGAAAKAGVRIIDAETPVPDWRERLIARDAAAGKSIWC
jgi:hypothetical protein